MEFPKKMVCGGTTLTVNNQSAYDSAAAAGYREKNLDDKGHTLLIGMLETLLENAQHGHFHDFATDHPTPKILLVNRFKDLEKMTRDGAFDN